MRPFNTRTGRQTPAPGAGADGKGGEETNAAFNQFNVTVFVISAWEIGGL
jgi:hypothetical protein